MMSYKHPTIVHNLPFILKDGRKHQSVDCHNDCHAPPCKPLLHHLLRAVQRQLFTAHTYNFNHNAAKTKPLYEVKALSRVTQNFRAYQRNYNCCKKRRKQLWHKSKNSRTSRQSIQVCSNAPPPMCRIQLTTLQQFRHDYPVVLAVNWITLLKS